MWRVPAVRSRREQLKPETRGRRRCRDELMERRARMMMTNEVVASIRDRQRVVSRQLGTMVPGRADNDRRAWPACTQRAGVQEANASPEATVWHAHISVPNTRDVCGSNLRPLDTSARRFFLQRRFYAVLLHARHFPTHSLHHWWS